MSAFDATIRVGEIQHELKREKPDGPAYAMDMILGMMTLAQVGPQQFMPIPFGVVRVPMDTEAVDSLIADLVEVREQMSTKPNIAVAHSLEGVDKAAQFQQGLRAA